MLAMKEINQRRMEFQISQEELFSIWMLGRIKKRKIMDKFEYQALRSIVKEGKDNVIELFEKKLKEIKVKGNRKGVPAVMYTEH